MLTWMAAPDRSVSELLEKVNAVQLVRPWRAALRLAHAAEDAQRRSRNEAAAAASTPLELIYRKLYLPEHGMFADLPADLGIGTKQKVPSLIGYRDRVQRFRAVVALVTAPSALNYQISILALGLSKHRAENASCTEVLTPAMLPRAP